ncbi:hypothetical protein [Nocardia brasiliensis]|uniref:hypothetical protein n=1 Tax=Nocardia brasiliensis TaxID=37326 RepID=UPI002457AF1F|nr:hypothetical protein [Nocardia brasiliensis]
MREPLVALCRLRFRSTATEEGNTVNYIDKAKDQLTDLVGKVVGGSDRSGNSQTVTIARPRAEVEQFWRDPDKLSMALGDLGVVTATGPTSFTWTMPGHDSPAWHTRLVAEEGRLRFLDAEGPAPGTAHEIRLTFADAPRGLGTEVTLQVNTPIPDLLMGAADFKVLYRARALLQTGEVPTIAHNPAARAGAR